MRAHTHTRSHGGILIYYFGSIFEITLSYWEATKNVRQWVEKNQVPCVRAHVLYFYVCELYIQSNLLKEHWCSQWYFYQRWKFPLKYAYVVQCLSVLTGRIYLIQLQSTIISVNICVRVCQSVCAFLFTYFNGFIDVKMKRKYFIDQYIYPKIYMYIVHSWRRIIINIKWSNYLLEWCL